MNLGPASIVAQSARVASRVIEGQAVVIVIDAQRLHTLNSVGTFVWSQAEHRIRVSELVERVAHEYDKPAEEVSGDVIEFARELVRLGALEVVEP
jgi:hypothetical protein